MLSHRPRPTWPRRCGKAREQAGPDLRRRRVGEREAEDARGRAFGLWFYANFAWIVPAFHPTGGSYKYFGLYGTLGGTPAGTFFAPLLNPGALLASLAIHGGRKLRYLVEVFGPLAFLSFLSPFRLCLGLPFLGAGRRIRDE